MNFVTLTGKTVIVTGANTGIGKETAKGLAKRDAKVILACRNIEKAEEARKDIIRDTHNENVFVRKLNLASLRSIKEFADEFNQNETRLDILVNNAGVNTGERCETEDHFEMHFGVNHLGTFYLTCLLLGKLKKSAPSRIVVVSSRGHELNAKLDFNNLQLERGWNTIKAYNRSKTANILFATHLAKLLEGSGVTTYSLHPGIIKTELAREQPQCLLSCIYCCCCCLFISTEKGAETTLYCCLEQSIAQHSGRYYSDCREKRAKSYATDPAIAEQLWKISAELCDLPANISQIES